MRIPLCGKGEQPLFTNLVQLVVVAMNQNGKDTHIRQMQVMAVRERYVPATTYRELLRASQFRTPQFTMYSSVR